jgi:NTE family protein
LTAAGRAIGWAARELTGLKVGLALGAGSAKGYAHVGVLKVLEQAGVTIDYVAGTSVGAGVAMLLAFGYRTDELLPFMDMVGSRTFRLAFSTRSLLSIDGVREQVRKIAGDARFEDLRLPLAVVAADIATKQEVIFRHGVVWPAVLASMAIPGIYPAQRMGDHLLVDGGVINPVPSSALTGMGADVVIAVTLAGRPQSRSIEAVEPHRRGQTRSMMHSLMRSIGLMQSKIVEDTASRASVVIEPSFEGKANYGLRSFTRGRCLIERGETAATNALPQLATALPWLRQ